jgi:hypothetical protein
MMDEQTTMMNITAHFSIGMRFNSSAGEAITAVMSGGTD